MKPHILTTSSDLMELVRLLCVYDLNVYDLYNYRYNLQFFIGTDLSVLEKEIIVLHYKINLLFLAGKLLLLLFFRAVK